MIYAESTAAVCFLFLCDSTTMAAAEEEGKKVFTN
jgi:hypothetical protein